MMTDLYLTSVAGTLFSLAVNELSESDRKFYCDFLKGKDERNYSAILVSNDKKHFTLDGVIETSDAYDYLGDHIATIAAKNSTVTIQGEAAGTLARRIGKRRKAFNSENSIDGVDLNIHPTTNDQMILHICYTTS